MNLKSLCKISVIVFNHQWVMLIWHFHYSQWVSEARRRNVCIGLDMHFSRKSFAPAKGIYWLVQAHVLTSYNPVQCSAANRWAGWPEISENIFMLSMMSMLTLVCVNNNFSYNLKLTDFTISVYHNWDAAVAINVCCRSPILPLVAILYSRLGLHLLNMRQTIDMGVYKVYKKI